MARGKPILTIRLASDKIDALKQIAEKGGCSVSDLIREMIDTLLDVHGYLDKK